MANRPHPKHQCRDCGTLCDARSLYCRTCFMTFHNKVPDPALGVAGAKAKRLKERRSRPSTPKGGKLRS